MRITFYVTLLAPFEKTPPLYSRQRTSRSSGMTLGVFTCGVRAQKRLRADLVTYLSWLKERVGYNGWRFDFAKGYYGSAVKVCTRFMHLRHTPRGSYLVVQGCRLWLHCNEVRPVSKLANQPASPLARTTFALLSNPVPKASPR